MIVTFTKLLVIRMVANVLSLFSRSCWIFESVLLLDGLRLLMSFGERLKKAISEPLAKPEINRSKTVMKIAIITPIVIG